MFFSASKTKVFAAKAEQADDAFQSFRSKTFVPSINSNTITEGLKTSLGEINLPIILNEVSDVFIVSENEFKQAFFLVYERMKRAVEPLSALVVAALLKHAELFKGNRVGVLLSGGNVDLKQLANWK